MANGGGGSRISGFFGGVLTGLVVCAIAAVALSLSAPAPERMAPDVGGPEVEGELPGGPAVAVEPSEGADREAFAPGPATPPAAEPAPAAPGGGAGREAEVIVVPAEEPAGSAEPSPPAAEGAEDSVAPQATWPESEPATGSTEPPANNRDEFTTPENPSQ